MNWLTNVVRPKIRSLLRREVAENSWIKCPETGQLVFYKDVEANQFVIPSSGYHMRISAPARLKSVFDDGAFEDLPLPSIPRAEVIDELYAAVVDGKPPLHDGAWGAATLEVCLAMLQSAREGRDVAPSRQVAVR